MNLKIPRCIYYPHTTEEESYIQAFNMFIVIHKQNTVMEIKYKGILILKEACPATSYVAAMFHPTIGQCAHQSLSNSTTLELVMIRTRNKGTLAGSHIAKVKQYSAKPTRVGFIRL